MTDQVNSNSDLASVETLLLQVCRNGKTSELEELLDAKHDGKLNFDINIRGKSKSTNGWTGLHLASYFGHQEVVECLLRHGADVNVINSVGDTPLHKAAFTSRNDIVLLLLKYNADVRKINGEGQTAKEVATKREIKNLIHAAEQAEMRITEERFLEAAREGNIEAISAILKLTHPPAINCTDVNGNTALHCASYCDQKTVSVLLLQNGIDPSIKNNRGQTALDLARSAETKQVLGVKPIKEIQKLVQRFEGPLSRKSKLLGWKTVWVVVERGVLSYYRNRADASSGIKRKHFKYMDDAKVAPKVGDDYAFCIQFNDGATHTLSVIPREKEQLVCRQRWINAVQDHISYSTRVAKRGGRIEDSDDDTLDDNVLPLGTMADALSTAVANQQVLEAHVHEVSSVLQINADCHSEELHKKLSAIVDTSSQMLGSLSHCLSVCNQQQEVHRQQLKQAQEKARVLEEALHALAKEHHDLEHSFLKSVRSDTTNFYSPFPSPTQGQLSNDGDDEFFDTFDMTPASSCTDFAEQITSFEGQPEYFWGGRTSLPAPAVSKNNFSVWTFLRQCIGRELSKITMPVVFNEPLTFLQRLAEGMEYIRLLDIACDCDDPLLRIQYVTAYAVSSAASNAERIAKPFNPLLGETYELNRPDKGFRIVLEQVSHHPPVSAYYTESTNGRYKVYGSVHPKIKFWGKTVEAIPEGEMTVELTDHNEVYSMNHPSIVVHNIIFGEMWGEQVGELWVKNLNTNDKILLNFRPCGWFGHDLHKIDGYLYDSSQEKLAALYGKWNMCLFSVDAQTYEAHLNKKKEKKSKQQSTESITKHTKEIPDIPSSLLLWQQDKRPPENFVQNYCFSYLAMCLNETNQELEADLPPTDSRFRKDMRWLEQADIDNAADCKFALEEKQRASRKVRNEEETTWEPVWFYYGENPHTGKPDWIYNGEYWNRDWSRCLSIFC